MLSCCVVDTADNKLIPHENTAMQSVALCQQKKERKKKKKKAKMTKENMKFNGESDLIARKKKGILIWG